MASSSKAKTPARNSTATETRPADAPAAPGAGAAGAAAPVAPAATDAPRAPAAGQGDEAQGNSAQPAATLHIVAGDTPMTAETEAAIGAMAAAAADAMRTDPPRLELPPRLVVTALADRRRRHGIDFGRAETDLDPEAIGEDGFRALVGDPLLKVEIVFRNGKRVRLTTFPPGDAVQAELDALAAEDRGDG